MTIQLQRREATLREAPKRPGHLEQIDSWFVFYTESCDICNKTNTFVKPFKSTDKLKEHVHFFGVQKEVDHLPESKFKVHLVYPKQSGQVTAALFESIFACVQTTLC